MREIREEEEEEIIYAVLLYCPRGKKNVEIDSIETGGSGGAAAAGSYLYGYARCYSFFFWSSRHGRHFFLNIFL